MGYLTGADHKALNRRQADAYNQMFEAWELALRRNDPLIPFSDDMPIKTATQVFHEMQQQHAQAATNLNYVRMQQGLQNSIPRPEPEPEPRGPSTWWDWMAYLEDTKQLRWWHWCMAAVKLMLEGRRETHPVA